MDESYPTLIVETDSLVREGLRLLLERTPFAPQTCALEPDSALPVEEPAILIIFARKKAELFTLVAKFRDRFPASRIVVLANESDFDILSSAMEAGANAILLTSISAEGLIKSLHAVVADNIFVMDSRIWPVGISVSTDSSAENGPYGEPLRQSMRGLSLRELEILKRIVEGDSNKHIARYLDIAEATVKAHVKTVLRKIGVSNRTQAAIWAMNNGLTQDVDEPVEEDIASTPQNGFAGREHGLLQ